MVGIPKQEYLCGTRSSLGDTASFGLDCGEVYKRSVVGIRVHGMPTAEKEALAAFFKRLNEDYRQRAITTEVVDVLIVRRLTRDIARTQPRRYIRICTGSRAEPVPCRAPRVSCSSNLQFIVDGLDD
jgi:hypothetical protein